jgi:hypothetical protein
MKTHRRWLAGTGGPGGLAGGRHGGPAPVSGRVTLAVLCPLALPAFAQHSEGD